MSILTENEKYGSGFLDESAPGAWVVQHSTRGKLCAIFSNRAAAEAYINDQGINPLYYDLSVWAINDTYPFPEDDALPPGPWNDPNLAEWRCPKCATVEYDEFGLTRMTCGDCDEPMERMYALSEEP